jgi:hypothetical protein
MLLEKYFYAHAHLFGGEPLRPPDPSGERAGGWHGQCHRGLPTEALASLFAACPRPFVPRQRGQSIIERVGERFTWIANLDVIGDQARSNDHYRSLMRALPCALRGKILWVYQGGDVGELAERAHEHKFVGLGGIVRLLAEQGTERVLAYLMTLGEILLDAGAQAHIFGLGSPYLLGRLGSAPWFRSFDTSKWLLAYKARAVLLENGERRSAAQLGLRLNSGECACNNIRQLHMWANPRAESKPMLSLWEDSDTIDF